MDTKADSTKLFCQSLDRFVSIRVFTPDQALDLLRPVQAGSKREYALFLLKAAVAGFETEIRDLLAPPSCSTILADVIMQELYSLCIRANPSLDVRRIEMHGTGDQVRRFCESLDRWVTVRRLAAPEQARLSRECAALDSKAAQSRVLEVLYPGLDHDAPRDAEADYGFQLDQDELLSIGLTVNSGLNLPGSGPTSPPGIPELPEVPGMPQGSAIDRLLWVMDRLRDPEKGCPWDRKQTHDSLKPYLIEEAHEVLEAIDTGCREKLVEELGDVLLQVVFHSRVAKEAGRFDFEAVAGAILRKLVHRHPHVFGEIKADTPEDVIRNWEAIKKQEKKKESVVDGVPAALPTLLKSFRLQEKASIVAPPAHGPATVAAELERWAEEFSGAVEAGNPDVVSDLYGDLLFSLVNSGRLLKHNAEFCLEKANRRFAEKVKRLERLAGTEDRSIGKLTLEELNSRWAAIENGQG